MMNTTASETDSILSKRLQTYNQTTRLSECSLDLIDVKSFEFDYLDESETWMTATTPSTMTTMPTNYSNHNNCVTIKDNNILEWITGAFGRQKANGSDMALVNKLDELKLLSPHEIDTRTFTRTKRSAHKRESLFNGSALATIYSPDDSESMNESVSSDKPNKTFEIASSKSANNTFTLDSETTFTICNDECVQMNNIDDVEKIAKLQEENLRQSCSNSLPQHSSIRTRLSLDRDQTQYQPNNTLTKYRDRDSVRHSKIADALVDDMYISPHLTAADPADEEDYYCQNGFTPDYESFLPPEVSYKMSTPVVSIPKNVIRTNRNVNFPHEPSVASRIMPNVSNLKAQSSYGYSKIGRSEPNLSKRLQLVSTLNNGMSNVPHKSNHYGVKSGISVKSNNSRNFGLIQGKSPSDSKLMIRNGPTRQPFHHQPQQTLGRITSPPPSQNQTQQLVGKVMGEPNKVGSTNLSRKSTFRVRDYPNSEENTREGEVNYLTNNNLPVTNGYQTNNTVINNSKQVQRNMSKIPGPRPLRSGIPVSGPRTAIPAPNNSNKLATHIDNSWKNGCY